MQCVNCGKLYDPEGHIHHLKVCPECLKAFDEMKKIREAIYTLDKYANLNKFGEDRMLVQRIHTCFSNGVKERFSLTLKKFIKQFALYESSEDFIPGKNKVEMETQEARVY